MMQPAEKMPERIALKYYGGKWVLAPWIISHFPKHRSYIELCGGAASVLLRKPVSFLETYNDIDDRVVAFFRVLRDRPDDLIRNIRLTPWARAEYDLAREPTTNDVEKARRFFIACWMSINAATSHTPSTYGWRTMSQALDDRIHRDIDYFHSDDLYRVARRFKYVQIENRDILDVVPAYDQEEALFYFDPPYVLTEQRTKKNHYKYDWVARDHENAAKLLKNVSGHVVISGYRSRLYADLYESDGWKRVDRKAHGQQNVKRVESLWLSPRTWNALQNQLSGLPLFSDNGKRGMS